jgi:hypothetical protein
VVAAAVAEGGVEVHCMIVHQPQGSSYCDDQSSWNYCCDVGNVPWVDTGQQHQ